jgi:dATP pyrophosphohydrolase
MKQVHYVVILAVRPGAAGPELLLARRAEGRYMGGTWQLISGGLESDETAWQGAIRELREETGLAPRELYRVSTLVHFYRSDNDSLNTAPMFCALVDAEATVEINDEHTAFEWVPLAAASDRIMWPSDRQAIDEVRTVILGNGKAKEYLRIPLPQGDVV